MSATQYSSVFLHRMAGTILKTGLKVIVALTYNEWHLKDEANQKESPMRNEDILGETGASWRTGQDDESALASKIITILPLSVCHTCHHVRAQLISE